MLETPTALTETPRHADVAAAINYLVRHYAEQPSLDDVAGIAGLSPHHFQRTFKAWTGLSPREWRKRHAGG